MGNGKGPVCSGEYNVSTLVRGNSVNETPSTDRGYFGVRLGGREQHSAGCLI